MRALAHRQVEVDEFALAFRVAMRRYGAWPDAVFDTPSVREALQATFARADVGGDGALNARELQFAMFLVNKFAVGEMTTDIMDFVDVNRDGRLSHEDAPLSATLDLLRGNCSAMFRALAELEGIVGGTFRESVARATLPEFSGNSSFCPSRPLRGRRHHNSEYGRFRPNLAEICSSLVAAEPNRVNSGPKIQSWPKPAQICLQPAQFWPTPG